MIAQELEVSLHMAFVEARQKQHEFITVEHLLLAMLDNPSAAEVLKACGVDLDELRGVLADFGVRLPPSTRIRVWDSTAEVRYLVIPMMPAGAQGLDQQQLAALITRDAMIGTGLALEPAPAAST